MNGHDAGPLYGLVPELRAAYPEWCFAITRRYGGLRLEAYRPASAGGLYAMITDDVTELRQELDRAAPAQAASRSASPCLPLRDLLPPPGRAPAPGPTWTPPVDRDTLRQVSAALRRL